MNTPASITTLSERLFAIATRLHAAVSFQIAQHVFISASSVEACSRFADNEDDIRIISLLYKHLIMPPEKQYQGPMNVRVLLSIAFGPPAVAQKIEHLQSMINRDLVQIDYRSREAHDHILGFTSAGLSADVQLTDRALFLIQTTESELLLAQAAERASREDSQIDTEQGSDESSDVAAESIEEDAATTNTYEYEEDEDTRLFRSSPEGQALDEMMGKKALFRQVELPDDFIYIPDTSIREQFEDIITISKSDVSAILRQYGISDIAAHHKPARHERTSILLSGAPGTGKTAAAYALAKQLDRELYITSADALNSPWVGVYQRNTRRLMTDFREMSITKEQAPILLIDECESLFSKRQEASQHSDRSHNGVIDILLQEIETFEGILILTTNTPDVFDEAFRRRIDYTMHLSGTSKETQHAIWKLRIPENLPGAQTINIDMLVEKFNLSAADITLIVRRTVQTAVAKDPMHHQITNEALIQACSRYLQSETALVDVTRPYGFV